MQLAKETAGWLDVNLMQLRAILATVEDEIAPDELERLRIQVTSQGRLVVSRLGGRLWPVEELEDV